MKYHLTRYGDYLSKTYELHGLRGLDAVHFYIVQTYKWPPSQVRSMNTEDILFLLHKEMHEWKEEQDAQLRSS